MHRANASSPTASRRPPNRRVPWRQFWWLASSRELASGFDLTCALRADSAAQTGAITRSGGAVTTKPRTPRPVRNAVRVLAVAIALVATVALLQPPAASAAPRHFSHDRLSAASHALKQSGVRGIAWYVDETAGRVVVTVDSTVSAADVASLGRSAGANAAALQIKHAAGVFRPLLSAGNAIYGGRYRCSLGFNVVPRQHVLLPHCRALRQGRQELVHQRQPRHADRPHDRLQLPRQRLRARAVRQSPPCPTPGGSPRRTPSSGSRSSAPVQPRAPTPARSPPSTSASATRAAAPSAE